MIDTRIDTGHEALKGSRIETLSTVGPRKRASSPDHGTAVAALLAGPPRRAASWPLAAGKSGGG